MISSANAEIINLLCKDAKGGNINVVADTNDKTVKIRDLDLVDGKTRDFEGFDPFKDGAPDKDNGGKPAKQYVRITADAIFFGVYSSNDSDHGFDNGYIIDRYTGIFSTTVSAAIGKAIAGKGYFRGVCSKMPQGRIF
jgi:hypothetical protein